MVTFKGEYMPASVLEQKKKWKRELLLKSAFDLFKEKGPTATAIDDIVRKAGVAKGTFYLYFRDRNEILNNLIADKSANLIEESDRAAKAKSPSSCHDEALFLCDELIERLKSDQKLLSFIHKNLPSGLYAKRSHEECAGGETARDILLRLSEGSREIENRLCMALELVSGTSYSAIVLHEPQGIDEMKPALMDAVARLI